VYLDYASYRTKRKKNPEETLEENRPKVLLTAETAEDIFLHIRTQVGNSESWRFRPSEGS
jgi:hypothetical protein